MLLDGIPVAESILSDLKAKIIKHKTKPKLAVILTTDNPASLVYVNKKRQSCAAVGMESVLYDIHDSNCTEPLLYELVKMLNDDKDTHGILVQLPLPPNFDKYRLFDAINPKKDVDCFSPVNVGKVAQNRCNYPSCTPQAIIEMGNYYKLPWKGKKVAIVNNSDIIGKPLTLMLTHLGSTVTMCHIDTKPQDLKEICRSSDVIVAAVGIPNFITPDMVTPKHVVYDIGTNRVDGVLCGDVSKAAQEIAQCTRNPRGVGPITVACLIKNTYQVFCSSSSDLTI